MSRASGPRAAALRATAALLLAFAAAGAAGAQTPACPGRQKPQQVAELLFGRNFGGRLAVSETQWARFLDREVARRFPGGLTVWNAAGLWRDPARNAIVHEPSKVIEIVLPGNPGDLDRLNEIVDAYKRRFRQQSVGLILRPACVSF